MLRTFPTQALQREVRRRPSFRRPWMFVTLDTVTLWSLAALDHKYSRVQAPSVDLYVNRVSASLDTIKASARKSIDVAAKQ